VKKIPGPLAVPRKPRRDAITKKCEKLFSQAIEEQDYMKAAQVVFYNVLKNYALKRIMTALYDANSFFKRSKRRKGFI